MANTPEDRILMAQIGAAHGIRGEVRVKPFGDDPLSFGDYGKLESEDGNRKFKVKRARVQKNVVVTKFEGVNDRNEAEALNGLKLYIAREKLPETEDEDEFYHTDLIGLKAVNENGDVIGTVLTLLNFGAGELIEVAPKSGNSLMFPFTKAVVPVIDLDEGYMEIHAPTGFYEEGEKEPEDGSEPV
ncbi:Ribosome maturation factor RimM [Pseudovibrio axinellae]|uniref:Ribosome maturation factor RimM n=1 Tax=Pseudovibrio axinellae TaxID=989403 RepID=A0A165ZNT8_9HYPH|nr:ribosome maturation factor RimM [Pseudovibrio axinellae]KZL20101.1 Ribosome maturation factor RimM [Pseudovibrio axinellae]SEQ25311.1 16S rRNA processing protein RimM [Pseudovibrio axinellae]